VSLHGELAHSEYHVESASLELWVPWNIILGDSDYNVILDTETAHSRPMFHCHLDLLVCIFKSTG